MGETGDLNLAFKMQGLWLFKNQNHLFYESLEQMPRGSDLILRAV